MMDTCVVDDDDELDGDRGINKPMKANLL